jgi:hypothetical protein
MLDERKPMPWLKSNQEQCRREACVEKKLLSSFYNVRSRLLIKQSTPMLSAMKSTQTVRAFDND